MRHLLTVLVAFVTLTGPAHGDPGDPPATADAKARLRDASIDRGFLASHAESIPEGEWTINNYEILGLGATYGITDQFDVSLTTVIPVAGAPFIVALAPKYVLYRGSRLVLAARVQGWFATDIDSKNEQYLGATAGVLADYYFDEDGRFAVHAGLSAGVADGLLSTGVSGIEGGALFTLDLGVSLGITKFLKVVVEGEVFGAQTADGFQVAPLGLVTYGVRFFSKHFSADLAMMRPFGSAVPKDVWAPGYPFLAFTVRP